MTDEEQIARVARALWTADGKGPDEVEAGDQIYSRDVLAAAWTAGVIG